MSVIKKGGRWYFRKRLKGHGRIFVAPSDYQLSNTRVGAEEAGRRRIAELLGERKPLPAAPGASPTLDEFVTVYLEHSDAKNEFASVKAKRSVLKHHLQPAFGSMPLDRIDFSAIEDFKNKLVLDKANGGKGLTAKTANNILSVLRRLLVLAQKRGKLVAVPELEWLPTDPSAFDFLTFEESNDLIEATEPEFRTMVFVAARCGLRQSELLGLKWENVDLPRNLLTVREARVDGRTKSTKSRRVRHVDLGLEVARELAAHRHLRGPYVFCDLDGKPYTPGACKWPLYHACTGARMRRIGWHVLRHTFCSHLAMLGATPQTIQKLAGHATLKMTERYMHLSPHVTANAARLLDQVGTNRAPRKKTARK
jgi:integrase